jgi:hypothetical protein
VAYLVLDPLDLGRIGRFESFDGLDVNCRSLAMIDTEQGVHRKGLDLSDDDKQVFEAV